MVLVTGHRISTRLLGSKLALRALSTALILLGIALVGLVVGLYAYASYEQAAVTGQFAAWEPKPSPTATTRISPTVTPDEPAIVVNSTPDAADESSETAPTVSTTPTPGPASTSTPTPTAPPQPPRWIRIPNIEVDSAVVEAIIKDGTWEVPKFVAGHLQGTANPGANSNVVLTGHVESLTAGNVFARIGELKPGDVIQLFVENRELTYRVNRSFKVKNDDISVVQSTDSEILTLITCTGTWNPLTRDFSHRLIVVAEPEPGPN